jgi:molybdopterin molybdotransferase
MMISLDEARRLIASHVKPGDAVATPLAGAWGGILDVVADALYPSADRSTMDGYVISGNESPGIFTVTGEIMAGAIPTQPLGKGEAMRIFTGALLPAGGGRVVMQEDVRREGDRIFVDALSENPFVRRMGSEAKPGDVVLPKGSRLGAAELAILAQVGAVSPVLVRRPIIRHIATGNELVAPMEIPGPAEIRDTNSSLLAGLFKDLGLELADSRRVSDDPATITEIAGSDWDLLLVSGGASVGDYDFGAEALRRLGFTIHFDRINLRPGKPLTFATRGRQVAFVIPGNPVSHFVCFHVAIRLAVEIMAGRANHWDFLPLDIDGGEPLRADPRETFWPARVRVAGGRLVVTPKRWSTSGDIFSLAGTNALARVNAHSPANGRVETLLLDLPASGR